jgi:hypothetical protein
MLEWMTTNLAQAAANIARHQAVSVASHKRSLCRQPTSDKGRLLASRTPSRGQRTGPAPYRDRFAPKHGCIPAPSKHR